MPCWQRTKFWPVTGGTDKARDFLPYPVCSIGSLCRGPLACRESRSLQKPSPVCESLVLPVNEPFGEESYQCSECSGAFEVDWGEGQVRYDAQ